MQRAVIDHIIKSPFLAGKQHKRKAKLLLYLFENRHAPVSEADIARDVFGAKTPEEAKACNARKDCGRLRGNLQKYADADDSSAPWQVFLPVRKEGYRLRLRNMFVAEGEVHAFWYAHLEPPRPVVIVCNEPLFRRDKEATTVIRIPYMDVSRGGNESPQAPPDELKVLLSERLTEPCHLYLPSGEIAARDRIANWFSEEMGVKTDMCVSRAKGGFSELADTSPILLGNACTNPLIADIMKLDEYRHLAYHVAVERYSFVEVRDYKQCELNALKKYFPDVAELSGTAIRLRDTPQPTKTIFGVVTRVPNPYGEGAVTILSAGYTKVLAEIARTLTSKDCLRKLLGITKWPSGREIPRAFEGLFAVRLGPLGIDAQAIDPALLCARPCGQKPCSCEAAPACGLSSESSPSR